MGLLGVGTLCLCLALFWQTSNATYQYFTYIYPPFRMSQLFVVDLHGMFLFSNNSKFAFGFYNFNKGSLFSLVVLHLNSSTVIWNANRNIMVQNSDSFVFGLDGNCYLDSATKGGAIWSTSTAGQGVQSLELQNSGNLIVNGKNGTILWQSFRHPTDTLVTGQELVEGMAVQSSPNQNYLSHLLQLIDGDVVLSAGFGIPQVYWSMADDSRRTNKSVSGFVHSAVMVANSWNFYDKDGVLLWQFVFSQNSDPSSIKALVLGPDGLIRFNNLQMGRQVVPVIIPSNSCSTPEPCDPYYVCSQNNQCQCPTQLTCFSDCKPTVPTCQSSGNAVNSSSTSELLHLGEQLDYFGIDFALPFMKSDINSCKDACLGNCSCQAMFFQNSTGNCYLFEQIGTLQLAEGGSEGYIAYVKMSSGETNPAGKSSADGVKHAVITGVIAIASTVLIFGILFGVFRRNRRGKGMLESSQAETDDDDNFFESFPGAPARYTYDDLCQATKNFSTKVGQGGFGSVYLGALQDGTRVAVKKLEGVGQGTKEFKAEVTLIGSIHHVHLVKLKGFCAEGPHRLLVYEYMGKGSLDKWIFKKNEDASFLDWDTRIKIAVGMAKGLAYLHEECESKIIHCDIKPENVLLDDNFVAKVSDFGLSKLMNREQSLVCTQLRGTRGYLAPEWIFNYAISEKSDIYSFGMVLLELVGGRKNYESTLPCEKVHFPTFAFKMMEQERLREIVDSRIELRGGSDERVINIIKVALWCIQEDMHQRPPMTKVVQMLEGHRPVPEPPMSAQLGSSTSLTKWMSESAPTLGGYYYSDVRQSEIRLSGPR